MKAERYVLFVCEDFGKIRYRESRLQIAFRLHPFLHKTLHFRIAGERFCHRKIRSRVTFDGTFDGFIKSM